MAARGKVRRTRAGHLLVAPYLLLLAAFGIGPVVYAAYLSVVNTDTGAFNGVANYIAVFTDYRFMPALENVGLFLLAWLPLTAIGVLVISFVLHARPGRFSSAMRMLYYLPGAFTGSATVLMWLFILDPTLGPFRSVLGLFHWQYVSQVVTPGRLAYIFALVAFSTGAGGWIVIMNGALNNISTEVIESASVDGARPWQLARYIKLPLIRKYIAYMLILSVAGGIQLFVEPQLFQSTFNVGGTTWSLNQLVIQKGITENQLGQAAALALVMLVLAIVVAGFVIFQMDFFDVRERRR